MSVLVGSDRFGFLVDGSQEAAYVAKVRTLSPIAYWTLGEHEGAVAYCNVNAAQNGTHSAVTLGNAGIGDGQVCPSYNGTTSYTNVQSAALAAAFDGQVGSVSMWARVSGASIWIDGTRRDAFFLQADANNFIIIRRQVANNQLAWFYNANGTLESIGLGGLATTAWMHLGLTWDLNAGVNGEVKAYYNGAQTGATQTALGTWAGAIVSATIGATNTTPNNPWSGTLAHAALWDSVLTPAQIAGLATV